MFALSSRKLQSLVLTPVLLSIWFMWTPGPREPIAPAPFDATYTVHGILYGTFPFNDPIRLISTGPVSHGTLRTFGSFNGFSQDSFIYQPNFGYIGSDSFTYHACDSAGHCADGTINLNVVNGAPNPGDDYYTVHDILYAGGVFAPLTANDTDPEGDQLRLVSITQPAHGWLRYTFEDDSFIYQPSPGFVGTDSVTYQVCDPLGLCATGTVIFTDVNAAPVLGNDQYNVSGITTVGPLRLNDYDPDQTDTLYSPTVISQPTHGTITGASADGDLQTYQPSQGYLGADSFVYRACDNIGLCSEATVTLRVLPNDQRENSGSASCHVTVGGPVNVTNGNMYLPQTDYVLPGVGPAIDITRTYNSNSRDTGLFGLGWSSDYDESVTVYNATFVRWFRGDGQATNFMRPSGAGAFAPVEGDFYGSLLQNGDGSFTLSFKDGSVHGFSSAGKLSSLIDMNGNQTTLTYTSGKLSSITDPFGRIVTATTDTGGRVLTLTDAIGKFATYAYGTSGELLSVTYADNSKYQFAYTTANDNLVLATVTDALGNIVENHNYDAQGRAISSEKQGGVERYLLSFVSNGETDVTDALGRVTKYSIDRTRGRNLVTRIEGLCGCGGTSQVRSWEYDNQLNPISMTDALGRVTNHTYDGSGNRLTRTDSTGTVTYTYNAFGEVLTRSDQLNSVTTNTYDSQGNLLTTTNALGKTTALTYDGRGLLQNVTDARGKVTSFAYDASGNLTTYTDARGNDTRFTYDARGRLVETINALGHVIAFAYDAAGRPAQITWPDGTTTGSEYDLAGRRTAIIDAKGNRSSVAYDNAYRVISQTNAANQTTSFGYDAMSNLVSVTDALARTTDFEYDDVNRLSKLTYPPASAGATRLFAALSYDAVGNATSRTDTAGRVATYVYDDANRLSSSTDAAGETTRFEFDALSRLTAVVDAIGQRYRFNYDAIGQLKRMHRGPDVTSFTYDAVGNRKTRSDYNEAVTNYSYDALNRLKSISYPDGTTAGYTYDKLSRLQTATNENGTVDFDYDRMNQVRAVTDVFGQVVNYAYDEVGNRTKLSLNSAVVQTYRYDSANRSTKILDAAGLPFTFEYDAANKLTQKRMPNGVKTTYQYDGLDRVTRILDAKGATVLADHQYQYDNANEITQIAEPTTVRNYAYDSVDRLIAATYSSPTQPNEAYAYDSVGNRISSHLSAAYDYQRFNRLASTTSANYSSDANGNQLAKTDGTGTTTFTWDFENRLRQVTNGNGSTVFYKYDALGRRIQRTSNGISTSFIYDGDDVLSDLNSDGSTIEYLNGRGVDNKLRLSDSRLSSPVYFSQDHLGSSTTLTDASTAVVAQISYDSYGNASTSANLTRFTYTGREFDSDTGLYYYRARWYDPQVGRFVSEDPIGLAGGINTYGYVRNSPVRLVDPFGLDWWDSLLGVSSQFSAGFGDTLTGGISQSFAEAARAQGIPAYLPPGWSITAAIRNRTPGGSVVDPECGWYKAGGGAAVAWSFAMAGAGAANAAAPPAGSIRWNAVNGPGPLGAEMASTFRGASYTEVILTEDTTLYRVHGGSSPQIGPYWTRTPPSGPLQSRLDSALNPEWGNTAESVVTIKVPSGTKVFEGSAGPQGGLLGGGNQMLVPVVDSRWVRACGCNSRR